MNIYNKYICNYNKYKYLKIPIYKYIMKKKKKKKSFLI